MLKSLSVRLLPLLLIIILLVSSLVVMFNVRPAYSEPRVQNLNTGLNYTRIQDAINAPQTLNGHTIKVYSGTYHENVVVNKSISLVGENRTTTIIFGGNVTDIVRVTANNANVTNFTIRNGRGPNAYDGIAVYGAVGCGISGNILTAENFVGVFLMSALNTKVIGNIFDGNGLEVSFSYSSVVVNNMVNGKPIFFLENKANQILTGATGQVVIVNSYNITVQNSILTHTSFGVQVRQSNGCRILNNDLSNDFEGVSVSDAVGTRITANSMVNTTYAVVFTAHVNNGIVSGNSIKNNFDGMEIWSSSNNLIFGNDMESSGRYGIYTSSSYGNIFHHNNFRNNANQVYSLNSSNVWDNGYPSGGNYWSDYAGLDLMHGPNQDEPGSDGVGDTPYVIDERNRDHYPILVSSLTRTGYNITVVPAANVGLQFHQVTTEGDTIVGKASMGPAPPPGGYWVGTYYDIMTTCSYVGAILIKISYDDSDLTLEKESRLQLVQWNSTGARFEGDITGPTGWPDGKTDIRDIALVAKYFGWWVPPAPSICDLTGSVYGVPDGKVDIRDIAFVARHYGHTSQNWINITTYIDTVNNIIYGQAPHLSIFGIRG